MKKEDENLPAPTYSQKKEFISRYCQSGSEPKQTINDAYKEIKKLVELPKKKREKISKEKMEKTNELAAKALYLSNIDHHYAMVETVDKQHGGLIIELCNKYVEEYSCTTASEKTLAQTMALSYVRRFELAKRLNQFIHLEYLSPEKTKFYSALGKELDRAERHFIAALSTLKQLKSPTLEVSVQARTAFIANNQQINEGQKKTQGEIIDA
ncbi:hypothetical protein OAR19_00130 [bacterium]|nr:hypothetical protein [bacterium]